MNSPKFGASVIHPAAGARCSFLLKQKSLSFLSSGRIFGRDARWDMDRANPPLTAESSVSTHTYSLLNIPPLDQSARSLVAAQWPLVLLARAAAAIRRNAAPCLAMRLRRAAPSLFIVAVRGVGPASCASMRVHPCPLAALTKCNQILRRRVIERCRNAHTVRPQSTREVAAAKCAAHLRQCTAEFRNSKMEIKNEKS